VRLPHNQRGFTLTEVLIVIGVFAIIFSFSSINLLGAQKRPQLDQAVDVLVSDTRLQQGRAMAGDAPQAVASSYGIYFQSSQYTLFQGDTYQADSPSNIVVPLEQNIVLSNITFANQRIVFAPGSGEATQITPGANSVTIQHALSGQEYMITLNSLGVIVAIQ